MARKYLGKAIGCRHRITLEEYPKASFSDLRKPADLAAQYPNLRPCKLQDWNWIYRSSCDYCPHAIFEKGQKKSPEGDQASGASAG